MQEVKFKYKIGDIVFIKGIEMKARIDALMLNENNVQEFRVIYWLNAERKNVWLQEWEIEIKS